MWGKVASPLPLLHVDETEVPEGFGQEHDRAGLPSS